MGALILPRSVLALIAIHRNQLQAAKEALDLAEQEFAGAGAAYGVDVMTWARALLLEVRGDARALTVLETAWANPLLRTPPQLVRVGPDLVRLAVGVGRPELAQAVVAAMDEATAGEPRRHLVGGGDAVPRPPPRRLGRAGGSRGPLSAGAAPDGAGPRVRGCRLCLVTGRPSRRSGGAATGSRRRL